MACRFTLTQRVLPQGVKFPYFQDTRTSFSKPQQLWRHLEVPLQFRCIVLKPGRQHVSIHGYTIMEQPVARNLFQSLAAGIMLVETQQRAATTLSARILSLPRQANRELLATNSKKDRLWLQTRSQNLISKMKPFLASPNETIEAASQNLVQTQKKCRGAKKKISQ